MPTTLSRLLPLALLLIFLSIFAFIAYAIYSVATDVKNTAEKRMEKKHVVVTKDGMRVGVKEVGREGYVDRTQRYVFLFVLVGWFGWMGGRGGMKEGGVGEGGGRGRGERGLVGGREGRKRLMMLWQYTGQGLEFLELDGGVVGSGGKGEG
ncbi:MAG: hypothetical protein Q9221_007660 [Calogaya cf. arnoldii]